MFMGVAAKSLRAICAALSLICVVVFTVVYVPVLRANTAKLEPQHLIPLFYIFFAALVPISFVLKKGRWRETTMMVASFGWAIAMGMWFVTIYGWSIASGVPVREVLHGYSGPLLNFLGMILFTANGLLSLRSLRRGSSSPECPH
jgi:hypothetical protein